MIQLGPVFRQNLASLLARTGMTQTDLANRMECKPSHVSRLLSGAREPGLSTLSKLAEIFSVPPDTLLRENNF